MQPVQPIITAHLFPEERQGLLDVLASLSAAQWAMPTTCMGWSVHDVVLHIWGGDIGILSARRDGYRSPNRLAVNVSEWDDLLTFINHQNDAWVRATQRTSPHLLCDFLRLTGNGICTHFAGLDPLASGVSVSWVGPDPAPVWLDTAREYTERWVHQQHIRDAVSQPGMTEPRFLAPVLDAFVRALPRALRHAASSDGASVRLVITGDAGGAWVAVREERTWRLSVDTGSAADATVTLDQDTAWRLFTKGVRAADAAPHIQRMGDVALTDAVVAMVSMIV